MSSSETLSSILARAAEAMSPGSEASPGVAGDRPVFVERALQKLAHVRLTGSRGRVEALVGITIEARGLEVGVGEICDIRKANGDTVATEVIGFRRDRTVLMPLGEPQGIAPGLEVEPTGHHLVVPCGEAMLGRVLDGLGRPMDGRPVPGHADWVEVLGNSPNPLRRPPIDEAFRTGITAIDALATLGRGQRIGIFSGSGVGKSTLLGMISRRAESDVNVIALIGERGREVREFIEDCLGPEGLARSVVVVATSDSPPLQRYKGAFLATCLAEHFRDQGRQVLFVMDSVTRFAAAARQIGLALGEPPTRLGYPPSFFSTMPKLVERLGRTERAAITGLYTVLVDADDLNEPVSDTMRGLLDGHVVLSRDLAHRHHYPPVDVLGSLSRLMTKVSTEDHLRAAAAFRELYAVYRDAEDLVQIGAYRKGTSEDIDRAIGKIGAMNALLRQGIDEARPFERSVAALKQLMEKILVKRFRFRLERLRRVRRILDLQARQALAEAIAERVRVESSLDDLRTVRSRQVAGMARLQGVGAIDVRGVLLQEANLAALDLRADRLALDLEVSACQEEERVSALADARRDLEAVRKLRTVALATHQAECQQEEIAALDEHTARQHVVARVREDDR